MLFYEANIYTFLGFTACNRAGTKFRLDNTESDLSENVYL